MKIGIFGDSWAKTIVSHGTKEIHDGYAWWELLAEKYEITNFGIPGSSVYFSYEEFHKHHSKFDKIIFLATEPGRLTFEVGSEIKHNRLSAEFKRHCNSYATADYYSKVFIDVRFPEDTARLNAAKEYFLWILNKKEQSEYKRLMLNEIKNLRPDALILNPAHSWDPVNRQVITCLLDISNMEVDSFGQGSLQDLMSRGYSDIRPCHLSRENNKILADKISNWIEHSIVPSIEKDDFVLPADDIELYFEIKKPV